MSGGKRGDHSGILRVMKAIAAAPICSSPVKGVNFANGFCAAGGRWRFAHGQGPAVPNGLPPFWSARCGKSVLQSIMKVWKSAASDDLKNSELSISQIASKQGRSPTSIRRLMRSEKIYRTRKRRGGLKPFAKMDALSPDYVRLGLYLIRSRGNEKETSFGKALGVSATRLGQMEAGRHDFTLRVN